jgi:signal transduction histidine kinase
MKQSASKDYAYTIIGGIILIVIFIAMSALFIYTSRRQTAVYDNQKNIARFFLNWTELNEELYAASYDQSHYYQLMVSMAVFESKLQDLFIPGKSNPFNILPKEFSDSFSAIYIKWPYVEKFFNIMISELSYSENPKLVYNFLTSPLVQSFEQDLKKLDRDFFRYSNALLRRFQLLIDLIGIFLLLLLSGLLLFLNSLHQRQKAAARIRKLTQSLLHVQEEEKKQIAYNLHDDIIQDLASIKMELENLSTTYESEAGVPSRDLRLLSGKMQELIQAARRISVSIRPYNLEHLGLVGAIRELCNDLVSRTGIQVEFLPIGLERVRMDYTTQINLYRITQEALQNIRKHSRASRVTVRLISSSPRIILRIKDNGRGFNPAQARTKKSVGGNHLGLTSIEERTRLLSGEFSISSREGEGTEIKVNVPLNERDILL